MPRSTSVCNKEESLGMTKRQEKTFWWSWNWKTSFCGSVQSAQSLVGKLVWKNTSQARCIGTKFLRIILNLWMQNSLLLTVSQSHHCCRNNIWIVLGTSITFQLYKYYFCQHKFALETSYISPVSIGGWVSLLIPCFHCKTKFLVISCR